MNPITVNMQYKVDDLYLQVGQGLRLNGPDGSIVVVSILPDGKMLVATAGGAEGSIVQREWKGIKEQKAYIEQLNS
ncbi:hypothetical protein IAQ67_28695 (plasmid) [Paenibacillus peoriae]|uniref:Uncharacterized protein n=1 Tax=Paenibacillus peoriae TaxID=59893 RepID=A0A7H0YHD3_9BACL|nr:hypothetical protein [Paenibacillus peoriae]QNR70491.1 hypothetical protein IAQ67_28695 [Paenibacillus peoriae]